MKKGFTLIELLVVVLIIGILAAVAVPQYQFAVDKSRVAPYLTKISDLLKAEHIYFLANGEYTSALANLDIDLTTICPAIAGTNELVDCPGNISITMMAVGADYDGLYLDFCPTSSCHYTSTTKVMRVIFNIATRNIETCDPYGTTRGQKLCKWLKPE